MAASDNRRKCPVCGAITDGQVDGRRLDPRPAPILGEHPRRRAQAAKIRKQNGGGK